MRGHALAEGPFDDLGDGETGSLGHFWLGTVTFIMLKEMYIVVTVNKFEAGKVYGYSADVELRLLALAGC